ncbi:MAG: hypothetical protein KBS74_03660 [Clostridiales bacterium]|nr:hypothetical protein [Candidatus Cacconaster stercorequi]
MAEEKNNQQQEQQPTQQTGTQPQGAQQTDQKKPDYDAIFGKLDAILDKRSGGIARSALKDDGLQDGEVAEIVKAYREHKQNQQTENANRLQTVQAENEQLKAQLLQQRIDTVASAEAAKLGIAAAQLPYVVKLADMSNVLTDKGEPDAAKISAALSKVLDDIPALKPQAASANGFVAVGAAAGSGVSTGTAATGADKPKVATKRWNRVNHN